jgi:hypothetical protein
MGIAGSTIIYVSNKWIQSGGDHRDDAAAPRNEGRRDLRVPFVGLDVFLLANQLISLRGNLALASFLVVDYAATNGCTFYSLANCPFAAFALAKYAAIRWLDAVP